MFYLAPGMPWPHRGRHRHRYCAAAHAEVNAVGVITRLGGWGRKYASNESDPNGAGRAER